MPLTEAGRADRDETNTSDGAVMSRERRDALETPPPRQMNHCARQQAGTLHRNDQCSRHPSPAGDIRDVT